MQLFLKGFFMDHGDFNLKDSLGHLLGRTTRAMGSLLQNSFVKAGHDVTFEQWVILVNLWRHNGQFQQQLADSTYKDKASITRLVDGLEKRNLVERIPDTIDRRHKRIYLTSKGKKMQKELKIMALKAQEKAQQGILPEDLKICKNVIVKIYDNISER
jgi:DNA-binding MarR family transcriptional regulator